tara:strand:+ start:1767 stop:2291 length:525 start_codon:yes stop_codon:yes gene_type:complete
MVDTDDNLIYEKYQLVSEGIATPSDLSGMEMYMQYTGVDGQQYLVQALPHKLGALDGTTANGNGVRFVANTHFGSARGGKWFAHELADIQVIHKIAEPVAAGGSMDSPRDDKTLADKGLKGAWNDTMDAARGGAKSPIGKRLTNWAANKLSWNKPQPKKSITTAIPGAGGGSST